MGFCYVNVDFVVVVFSYKLQKPGLMKQMQDLALKWSKMEKLMFHCKRFSQRGKDMGELPGMNWGPVALDKLRLLFPHLEKGGAYQREGRGLIWGGGGGLIEDLRYYSFMARGNVRFQRHARGYFAFKRLLRCRDDRGLPLVEKICDSMGFRAAPAFE